MSCQGRRTKGLSRISVYGLAPPCLFWAGNKLLLTLLNASKSSCALLLRGSNPTPAVLLFFFSLVCFLVLPACTASPRLAGHQIPRVQPPLAVEKQNHGPAGQQQASPRRVEKARLILPHPLVHGTIKTLRNGGQKTERGAHFRCIEIPRN